MSSTNESAKYFKQGDVYFCALGLIERCVALRESNSDQAHIR